MARLVISEDVRNMDSFVPGQIFAFDNVVPHANPTVRLGMVGTFSPDQEIRFGNLEFSTDSRGDLLLTGLATSYDAPEESEALSPDFILNSTHRSGLEEDLAFSSDPVIASEGQESAPAEHILCTGASEVIYKILCQIDPIELMTLNEAHDLIRSYG